MPLSEHEQRLLEQIEQALYAEDPKFAHSWRSRDLNSVKRTRIVRAAVVFVLGVGLLLAGVITKIIPMGVAGFVAMLVGAYLAVSVSTRFGRRDVSTPRRFPRLGRARGLDAPPRARGPHQSWRERLEERWQRRQDNR